MTTAILGTVVVSYIVLVTGCLVINDWLHNSNTPIIHSPHISNQHLISSYSELLVSSGPSGRVICLVRIVCYQAVPSHQLKPHCGT